MKKTKGFVIAAVFILEGLLLTTGLLWKNREKEPDKNLPEANQAENEPIKK